MRAGSLRRAPLLAVSGLALAFLLEPASLVVSPTPEVEPNDSAPTATPLDSVSSCQVASGAITPAGDVDYYSFTAPPGARLWALADPSASTSSRDTILTLFGPDGTSQLETDDDDGMGTDCAGSALAPQGSTIAGKTLVAGGTYFLRVQGFAAESVITSYKLSVVVTAGSSSETEPNDDAGTANPIVTSGSPIGVRNGNILTTTDVDVYSVFAAAGSSLLISSDGDPERNGGTDMVLDLLAPDGTTVLFTVDNTDASGLPAPPAESFCYSITTPGTYFVRARGFQSKLISTTGTYSVMVADCSPAPEPPGVAGYYTVAPCRVADTRDPPGPFGGPALQAAATRAFPIAGRCGIPAEADAVAVNVTITQPTALGHLTLYPLGASAPLASTINYRAGQTRANNAIVPLGDADSIAVACGQSSGTTHFILDVVGYFRLPPP